MKIVLGILFTIFLIGVFAEKPQNPWNPPPFRGQWKSSIRVKRSTQCYGDLGCFSNNFPFNNTGNALPLNPRFIQTKFYLFSSINERFPTNLRRGDGDKLRRSRFDGTLPTKLIIHGFLQSGMVLWTKQMAESLIRKERTNVFIVDWGHGSGWPYTQAAANTRVVAAEVAKMIEFLVKETTTDISKFHLIGHSLGAHVAGYVGETLNGLGRITGLDPAEPNFKNADTKVRLDPDDAIFVDVIHTDGSPFNELSGYGLLDPVGDIDFYPNGGEYQPGCPRENLINLFSESYHYGIEETEDLMSCSHSRSIFLFTESINNDCRFTAYPCDDFEKFKHGECIRCGDKPCPVMGLDANKYESTDRKPRGKYYLTTMGSSPYCGYTYRVEVHLGAGMQPTEGLLELGFIGSKYRTANHTVYSDNFQAGQVYNDIFVSADYLSDISRVVVRFVESSRIWSWLWTGRIKISKIVVTDGKIFQMRSFCGADVTINTGGSAVLAVC